MAIYFCANPSRFYHDRIAGADGIPAGAIPIDGEHYFALLAGQTNGQYIALDEQGQPALFGPKPPDELERVTLAYIAQSEQINGACESAITAGFWSAALGDRYFYSSQLNDQLNLTSVILGAQDNPYACRDEQGIKAFRSHTAQQLRQVGDDFTAFKLQLLQKANTLKQRLDQALASNDVAAINAVVWESAE